MASEKNHAAARRAGGVDVFQPFTLNNAPQSLRIGGRELAEDSEQPAQILKTTAQQAAALFLSKLGKCQL